MGNNHWSGGFRAHDAMLLLHGVAFPCRSLNDLRAIHNHLIFPTTNDYLLSWLSLLKYVHLYQKFVVQGI